MSTLLAVATLALAAQTMAAPAYAAGSGTVSTGSNAVTLNVRAQPTTASKVVGSLRNGTHVTLSCWVSGQTVNGRWGRTSLWHWVASGYVSDGFVATGTNGPAPGEPKCGSTPAPAPPSSLNARVDAFVKKWNGKYADFDGSYGAQCVDLFNFFNRDVVGAPAPRVKYAYQLFSVYSTARYNRLGAGAVPRKGDVAVWSATSPGSGGAGHVAIVLGRPNSATLTVLTQHPGATRIGNLSTAHLLGYLRPKA